MTQRFENPPLVELVAEIRWGDDSGPKASGPGIQFAMAGESFEKQASQLTSAMASIGYGSSERLIPHGFPAPAGVPVIRFKYAGSGATDDNSHLASTLFQLGSGLFTINAVQPYKSWADFSPVVKSGLEQLLQTMPANSSGFTLLLRYIDAFKENLTNGLSHFDFISEVLGFKVSVPTAVAKLSTDGKVAIPTMQIVVPIEFGRLQIQLADGKLESEPVFLMEIVVAYDSEVDANVDKIMASFTDGRKIVHELFIDMTRSLHKKMHLIEEAK